MSSVLDSTMNLLLDKIKECERVGDITLKNIYEDDLYVICKLKEFLSQKGCSNVDDCISALANDKLILTNQEEINKIKAISEQLIDLIKSLNTDEQGGDIHD